MKNKLVIPNNSYTFDNETEERTFLNGIVGGYLKQVSGARRKPWEPKLDIANGGQYLMWKGKELRTLDTGQLSMIAAELI